MVARKALSDSFPIMSSNWASVSAAGAGPTANERKRLDKLKDLPLQTTESRASRCHRGEEDAPSHPQSLLR